MIDYHMHSRWSGDSSAEIIDICKAAVNKGLREICITEHLDFDPTDISYQALNYAECLKQIEQARNLFKDKLTIRFGTEVDYQDKFKEQIRRFLDDKPFDYIIGSAHYIDGILLENHDKYFPGKEEEEAYLPYFDNVLKTVETGWFDTLAHLDLCKRYGVRYYGPFGWARYEEQISEILCAVIERKMTLEINTSGLRQSPGDTYPTRNIMELYYSLGGRQITVGSDAHNEEDVGAGIEDALEMARAIGFESVDTYHNRNRMQIGLDDVLANFKQHKGGCNGR